MSISGISTTAQAVSLPSLTGVAATASAATNAAAPSQATSSQAAASIATIATLVADSSASQELQSIDVGTTTLGSIVDTLA